MDVQWHKFVQNYYSSYGRFYEFCSNTIDKLKKVENKDTDFLKEASYLISKLKKKSLNIKLRPTQVDNYIFNEIRVEYEKLQNECIENFKLLDDDFVKNRYKSRKKVAEFMQKNKKLYPMIYMKSPVAYKKLKDFVSGDYKDNSKAKEMDKFLYRFISKPVTKTSPLWMYNRVTFLNHEGKLDYKVNNNQITPNYVFILRVYEELAMHDDNISSCRFKLTTKVTKIDDSYYIFRSLNDNYKIYKAKDSLVKLKANPIFDAIFEQKDEILTVKRISDITGFTGNNLLKLVRQLYDYGIILRIDEINEGINAIDNLISWIENQNSSEINKIIKDQLCLLRSNFYEINQNKDKIEESVDKIYETYERIIETLSMPKMSRKIMIYSDFIDENKAEYFSEKPSDNIYEMLKSFPAFDINELIQKETEQILLDKFGKPEISMEDDNLMQILTDVNTKMGKFWMSPWEVFDLKSEKGKFLQNLKIGFIESIKSRKDEEVIDIEKEILHINEQLRINNLAKEGFYTLFYQKDGEYTVLNKVYPAYGAFYQRFMRFTDIPKQGLTPSDFYLNKDIKPAEIFETLGFNANVVEVPYFKNRYRDIDTRGDHYNNIFSKVYSHKNGLLKLENNEFFIEYNKDERIAPIITSSLVRAFYPGRLAFLSSLFSNISYIIDCNSQILNEIEGNIKICPRITYKDIILERKTMLMSKDVFESYFVLNPTDCYLKIRKVIEENLGSRFFYKIRHSETSDPIKSISSEFGKPQYCDLDDILSYDLFIHDMRQGKDILLTETSPKNLKVPEFAQEVKIGND